MKPSGFDPLQRTALVLGRETQVPIGMWSEKQRDLGLQITLFHSIPWFIE